MHAALGVQAAPELLAEMGITFPSPASFSPKKSPTGSRALPNLTLQAVRPVHPPRQSSGLSCWALWGNLPQPGKELALDIPQSWLSAATKDAPGHRLLCGPAKGPVNNYTLTHTQPQQTVSTRASSSDKLPPNNK